MTQKLSVSLDDKHIRIVERHAKRIGITAFSTALQSLIVQFDQMQKAAATSAEPVTTTDKTPEAAPTAA